VGYQNSVKLVKVKVKVTLYHDIEGTQGRTVPPMLYLGTRGVGYTCKSTAHLNIIRNKVIIQPRIIQFLIKIS
jgi:hypothetical protein